MRSCNANQIFEDPDPAWVQQPQGRRDHVTLPPPFPVLIPSRARFLFFIEESQWMLDTTSYVAL